MLVCFWLYIISYWLWLSSIYKYMYIDVGAAATDETSEVCLDLAYVFLQSSFTCSSTLPMITLCLYN